MAQKLMKLRIHPRTFCEEELIVNVDAVSKDKFPVAVGDIIEISVPGEATYKSCVCLQIASVPQDIQTKGGPLSVGRELAQLYNLEGVKEVNVRKVDKDEVGIDLLELKFKADIKNDTIISGRELLGGVDQCLTRSDMWRFTSSLIGKCVYLTKKLEFVTIRTQVSGLWSQGEEVQCGAVINDTRIVFRSASCQMFLLIQISSEMWDFDTSGDLYFDKLVGGFLKELFHRWGEVGCSHEVTLAFFWRAYYQKDKLDELPNSTCQHMLKDGRSIYFEDFYKVIVEAESVSDWSGKVTEIKRSFLQLKDNLHSIRGETSTKISSAAEGNLLEAINLAINVFDKGYIDCNFMLTGQQIAIVTAGVGVFEVDHDLTRMTKERIINGGIGVDLVCLTEQPLHAVPLFRFHQSTTFDDQEYYHIPHWINYSFYNPLRFWNRFQFRPQLQISDHLINIHLNRGERRTKGTKLYNSFSGAPRLPHAPRSPEPPQLMKTLLDDRLQDSDVYDDVIFTSCSNDHLPNKAVSMTRVQSAKACNRTSTKSLGASVLMKHYSPEKKNMAGSVSELNEKYHSTDVKFEIGESPPDPFDGPGDRLGVPGTSPGSRSTGGIDWRAREFTSTVQPIISRRARVRSDSEYPEASSSFRNSSSSFRNSSSNFRNPSSSLYGSLTRTGSAESARGLATPRAGGTRSRGSNTPLAPRRRGFFINPFDSSKMHTEITAYHRRWMHTFPRNREGFLFQIHHAILEELAETSSVGSQTPSNMSRQSSMSSIHMTVGGEEGNISQLRRRIRHGSMSLDERDRDASRNSDFTPSSRGSGERLRDNATTNAGSTAGAAYTTAAAIGGGGSKGSGSGSRLGLDEGGGGGGGRGSGDKAEAAHGHQDGGFSSSRDSRSHSGEKLQVQSLDVNVLKGLKQSGSPMTNRHLDSINSNSSVKQPVDVRKLAEDFASVRRTGVDWKSLTEPACLPITTDYFPTKQKLLNDYYEHPSKLVVSSYNYGEEEFPEGKTTLPWRTNHQHMTTFKAFREMISQRLTQGFQLVFDPPRDKSLVGGGGGEGRGRLRAGGHDSVFSLHQAITEQREAIYSKTKSRRGRRHGDIVAKFSLGRVFHKVELAYPDLVISIYKSKGHQATNKVSYSYQLCSLTSEPTALGAGFQSMSTAFRHTRVEDYNWNYLDQHICGHSDFEELGESQKYWRCRYLLLPYESPRFGEGELAATREAQQLIANFVRFMDFLNHIKRTPQTAGTASLRGGVTAALKRHQSLPASHAGFLSPMSGRSRTPTPQEPHSNVTSPSSSSTSLFTSPAPPRSRSKQRKLSEIDEEDRQHGNSSGDSDQLRRKTSDQSSRSRTPDINQQGQGQQQRSHSPRVRERDGERGRRERRKKSSRKTSGKPPIDTRDLPESNKAIGQGLQSGGDIFERGYDDEPVDSSSSVSTTSSRPISPRQPHKANSNRSPLLLRRNSRDDLAVASGNKKDPAKEMQFGSTKSTKRDLSLDRMRSPRGSMKRRNLPVEVTPPTPVSDASKTMIEADAISSSTLSSFDDGISILNTDSPPQLIMKGLEDPENGIDFLVNQSGLKAGCFLAMEAVDWVMERVSGATTRAEAVRVLQVLVSEQLIIHASGDFQVPFLDGYFIYSMPHREKQDDLPAKENMDRSFLIIDPMDFNTFSKCWFEVGVRHPSKLESPANTSLDPSPSFQSPIISLSNLRSQSPFYMDFEKQPETLEMPTYMANRYVELNPDPGSRSDRPEWCYVRYDHTYHPLRAFQFELQWMVTTIEIFHQLIQGWTHRANMCGFTLVAAPMLQSLSPSGLGSSAHPFRRPLFIPLHLPPSIPNQQLPQFELITRVLSEIINSTGFLLDPGSRHKDSDDILSPRHQPGDFLSITSRFYIHHSGCSLIQPVCESITSPAAANQAGNNSPIRPVSDNQALYYDSHHGGGGSGQTSRAMEVRHTQEKHDQQQLLPWGVGASGGQQQLRDIQGGIMAALPRSSSTPSASPIELKGLWLKKSSEEEKGEQRQTMRCGFYWHRNYLLPKQKNIASNLLSQHDRVLSELTRLCSGEDDRLGEIFEGLLNPKTLPPPPL